FRELMTRAYEGQTEDLFQCDLFIYDMATAENAAAIYEQQRDPSLSSVEVGDGGYRYMATWFFHQGPYYVTILNADEGEAAEAFSEELARAVSAAIGGGGD